MPQKTTEIEPKNHNHYSKEVQVLAARFTDTYLSFVKLSKYNLRENLIRMDSVKAAWDALLRARREETGVAYYLNKKQYKEATNVNSI